MLESIQRSASSSRRGMAGLIHNHNTSNEKSMGHIGQNQLKIGRFVFETDNIKGADAADGRRMRHDKGHSCTQNRGRIYSARKYEKGLRIPVFVWSHGGVNSSTWNFYEQGCVTWSGDGMSF